MNEAAGQGMDNIDSVAGVRIGVAGSEIGYVGRPDLLLAAFDPGTTVAGTLSTSATAAPPLLWTRDRLKQGARPRGLVVNAGNANCFTGAAGMKTVDHTAHEAARLLRCHPEEIFVASTGKIGQQIDRGQMSAGLEAAYRDLNAVGWETAAQAIMTTDRFPKSATVFPEIDGVSVVLHGVTKGSTMIAPGMATTLSFLFTDAALPTNVLQAALSEAVDETYNMLSVDSTQSTNDTILLFATGAGPRHAGVSSAASPNFQGFRQDLRNLLGTLMGQILDDSRRDGIVLRIRVTGAETAAGARRIARTVRDSLMVRQMVGAGERFLLGRLIAAIGMPDETIDQHRLDVSVGGVSVIEKGDFVSGTVVPLPDLIRDSALDIGIELGLGSGAATGYTVA